MADGEWAAGNKPAVALFTLLSVAWADRITATRSSNGDEKCNSVRGWGFAARNRSKIARRFASFTIPSCDRAPTSSRRVAAAARYADSTGVGCAHRISLD